MAAKVLKDEGHHVLEESTPKYSFINHEGGSLVVEILHENGWNAVGQLEGLYLEVKCPNRVVSMTLERE